jgi:hypothetical protein
MVQSESKNNDNTEICLFFMFMFFLAGAIGIIISVNDILKIRRAAESENTECGVITQVNDRHKSFNTTVYFFLETDKKEYRINLFKLLFYGKQGDKVVVIFNTKRSFFILKDYLTASYASVIAQIIICMFSWFFAGCMLMYYKKLKA